MVNFLCSPKWRACIDKESVCGGASIYLHNNKKYHKSSAVSKLLAIFKQLFSFFSFLSRSMTPQEVQLVRGNVSK